MNLAAEAAVRPTLRDEDAVNILSSIADYATMTCSLEPALSDPEVGEMQQQFQCLKAVSFCLHHYLFFSCKLFDSYSILFRLCIRNNFL